MVDVDVDFLAIGAHADDVELMAGGTIARLIHKGKSGIIVDITDASAGTRGTVQIRAQEAMAAAKMLGLKDRINLGFPDARLQNDSNTQKAVINIIRKFKPKILLTHHTQDEHPDHIAAAEIVKSARFKAGLKNAYSEGEAYRPARIFHFMGPAYFEPTFCVDISDFWKIKMKSIMCYKSQFFHKEAGDFEGVTEIASPDFLDYLKYKHRFFGWRIKREYAEPFYCQECPEVDDITSLGGKRF